MPNQGAYSLLPRRDINVLERRSGAKEKLYGGAFLLFQRTTHTEDSYGFGKRTKRKGMRFFLFEGSRMRLHLRMEKGENKMVCGRAAMIQTCSLGPTSKGLGRWILTKEVRDRRVEEG